MRWETWTCLPVCALHIMISVSYGVFKKADSLNSMTLKCKAIAEWIWILNATLCDPFHCGPLLHSPPPPPPSHNYTGKEGLSPAAGESRGWGTLFRRCHQTGGGKGMRHKGRHLVRCTVLPQWSCCAVSDTTNHSASMGLLRKGYKEELHLWIIPQQRERRRNVSADISLGFVCCWWRFISENYRPPNFSVVTYGHAVALRKAGRMSTVWYSIQLQKQSSNVALMNCWPREREEEEAFRGSEKVQEVCVSI